MDQYGEIILYQSEDGLTKIDVRFEDQTVWLTQQQMAELFQSSRSNIVEHIRNIYDEGELNESSTCRKFRQVRTEGNRQVSRELPYYNLDMILSLGYRIKSVVATRFRQWATARLKEYMIKGFVLDDERLKGHGGGDYWRELLDRIRDIRSSEKVMYRQVLDLYATSMDYDPSSPESIQFFKIVRTTPPTDIPQRRSFLSARTPNRSLWGCATSPGSSRSRRTRRSPRTIWTRTSCAC